MPERDQPRAGDRADDRTTDEELFTFEEDQADADLPDWVRAGEYSIQPEESLTPSEQATIEEKRETLPGFEERLDRFVSAVNAPEGPASAPSPEQTGNTNASRQQISGDSAIEWFGSGPRTVTDYSEPRLTAADFGGQVPARVNYIVIFDVDAAGRVVPGTLIVRQSSGYTQADQKVRQAILGWRFEPSPSAPTVTAIATLQITRDEIR
jgi:TonB family protein